MDKELVFRAVLSVVGLVLTVAAITRERSGNHHWWHYLPIGLVTTQINSLVQKLHFEGIVKCRDMRSQLF